MKLAYLVSAAVAVAGHGHMVLPASTRMGGKLSTGGSCVDGQCFWFSNNVVIPGEQTLAPKYRTIDADVEPGSVRDIFKTSPWRAPGTAPVFGHGCGVAGGDSKMYLNGGIPPKGIAQGFDGVLMPEMAAVNWTRGESEQVAWAISANHGGGYAYRLCKTDGNITEECFQRTQLKFASDQSRLIYINGSLSEPFPMVKVTEGVYPPGSEWARNPIPACNICDGYDKCGVPMPAVPGSSPAAKTWNDQVDCYAACDGSTSSKLGGNCPVGTPQFPEPVPGASGFGKSIFPWSVLDEVMVPKDIEAGSYLLSWRWECEESTQVWENCADINII